LLVTPKFTQKWLV